MKSFFQLDNKFFTWMATLTDLFLLNLVFLFCCLPIITIGTAYTSLYHVTLKLADKRDTYLFREFFRSFRENLKQSTFLWVFLLIPASCLYASLHMQEVGAGILFSMLRISSYLGIPVLSIVFLYVFPLLAKFHNTLKHTIVNAFLIALRHLPTTLIMAIITVFPVLLVFGARQIYLPALLFWLLAGCSLPAYFNSFLLNRIFDRYSSECV